MKTSLIARVALLLALLACAFIPERQASATPRWSRSLAISRSAAIRALTTRLARAGAFRTAQGPPISVVNLQTAAASGNGTPLFLGGRSTVTVVVTGSMGGSTVTFKVSGDGVNYVNALGYPPGSTTGVTSTAANGTWVIPTPAMVSIETPITGGAGGTITVTATATGGIAVIPGSGGGGGPAANVTVVNPLGALADGSSLSVANNVLTSVFNNAGWLEVDLATAINHLLDDITVYQGPPGTIGNSWYASVTDGTSVLGTSTHPFRTDPTGTTNQPITAASLPLPTGASTAAKQPALGTAGTASSDVITVQGIASMTKLLVTPDANSSINLNQVGGSAVALGQAAMASSIPVAIANNQSAISTNATTTGAAAHGSSVSGNPVLAGVEALNTQRAIVSNGQVTRLSADLAGRLITTPYCGPEDILSGRATSTGTGDTQLIAAQAAGVRIYITSVQISNSSTTTSEVDLKDGSTILATLPAPANTSNGGGAVTVFPVPLKGTAATAFNFASTVGVTTMKVSVQGFKGY